MKELERTLEKELDRELEKELDRALERREENDQVDVEVLTVVFAEIPGGLKTRVRVRETLGTSGHVRHVA